MRILICLFFLMPHLSALYMGNPAETQIIERGFFIPKDSSFGVKLGYEGDIVFDRKMRGQNHAHGRIDQFKIGMNQGVLTLNYLDRFEVYGTVGAMFSTLWHRPKRDNGRREYETHDHWTAGTGARFLLAEWGNTGIGFDAKVQYGRPHFKWIAVNGVSHATGAHLNYREWQASFAAFHTIGLFSPYLGVKYSNVHAHVCGLSKSVYPHSEFNMYNRDRFGIALGCTVSQGQKIDLYGEVQLFDETGLTFGGNIKF